MQFKFSTLVALVVATLVLCDTNIQEISSLDKLISQLQERKRALLSSISEDQGNPHPHSPVHHSHGDSSFDYFTLSLQWPGTICEHLKPCFVPKDTVNDFKIHGLWPDRNTSGYPSSCESSAGKFDFEQLKSILPDLHRYWPDFKPNTEPEFWAHEWNKHGTCASALPELSTQLKYFTETIKLVQSLNIMEHLAQHKIAPNDETISVLSIQEALKKELGAEPSISCGENGSLKEMRFCVSKDLKIIECKHAGRNGCSEVRMPLI
jgi:ribonuclease T2